MADRPVRVRFAPAPSGDLHVGNVRTALYNWAFARGQGGSFVFRVEDTDRSRVTDESYSAALDVLRWLALDWDEGPEKGGPHAPYRQSERLEIYARVAAQLQEQGAVYPCYCTQEEVRERAAAAHRPPGYDGHCRELTPDQLAAFQAEDRRPVLRFRMPPGETTFTDLVRGEVTVDHSTISDFALTRGGGHPLYMLAASVDDVLMKITHIIRGEDLLSSVPRQLALYAAMGVAPQDVPQFGHLPLITGADSKPLSKRHGEVSLAYYRREGFTPEAMVNYLALLGWSLDADHDLFTLDELVSAFRLDRVSHNPARFDLKKLEAINGDKIRELGVEDLTARVLPFLQQAGLVDTPTTAEQAAALVDAVPLLQTRIRRLTDAVGLLGFLFVDDDRFVLDEADAAKTFVEGTAHQLAAAADALQGLTEWTAGAIEAALRAALVEGLGLKPKVAFTPLYVAVTGRRVGLPIFDSMAMVGRDRSLRRIRAAGVG
ncbi:MAG: glutamate--tRNA ligase [Actinomycetota bacterium]|nr:glutamate--tRNA ligase [Actinomycetota bacterium]